MTELQLAQINVGRIRAPLDDAVMADFVGNLERINGLADTSPGFVWRYTTEDADDATGLRPFDDDDLMLINYSVWASREALWNYVYRTAHLEFLRRRREWFDKLDEGVVALWWVPAGHRPGIAEAIDRLDRLRRDGPSPDSFTFREFFDRAAVADATPG
jgi:hypothetical protein